MMRLWITFIAGYLLATWISTIDEDDPGVMVALPGVLAIGGTVIYVLVTGLITLLR